MYPIWHFSPVVFYNGALPLNQIGSAFDPQLTNGEIPEPASIVLAGAGLAALALLRRRAT